MSQPSLIVPLGCHRCGGFIATALGFVGSGFFLQVPPFLIREGEARCSACGCVFYWNGHKKTIEQVRALRYKPIDKWPKKV